MKSGELRHRGVIQKQNDAASTFNQGATTWSTYATVWFKLRPTTGTETDSTLAKKREADATHEITTRYIRGVKPSMRLSFEGRIFKFINCLNVDERSRELSIEAREETDG